MDSEAVEQAEAAASAVRELLGLDGRAAYIYGSATMGGLKPSSDLDLFVVCRRPTSDRERLALARRLMAISREGQGPDGWRPLEVTMVAESEIRPWRHPAVRDFQYGEWLRDSVDAGTAKLGPVKDADLALLLSMVRLFGQPIFGPAPDKVLPLVPGTDLLAALNQTVEDVMPGLRTMPVFALLTLARVWFTLETGHFASKDAAGAWVARRLQPASRSVLLRAVEAYATPEPWDCGDLEVAATAAEMMAAMEPLRSRPQPARAGHPR